MARFFIERPIFAIVVSIIITLMGILAGINLPIAQYPQITPPVIGVDAIYIGANADVVQQTVAQAIEEQVNGVEGMDYMESSSSDDGSYSLNVQFKSDTDSDIDAVQTQNRVNWANSSIPSSVQQMGITTKKTSNDMTWICSVYSPNGTYTKEFLDNYLKIFLVDEIKRVPGVGDVTVFGGDYSMRIWLKPDKMAQLGVTIPEVSAAIQEQNQQAPAGTIGKMPVNKNQSFQYTGSIQGRLSTEEEFNNIIIRSEPNGAVIKIKDIGHAELGAQSYDLSLSKDGMISTGMGVKLTSDANAMETVKGVKAVMENVAKNFPPDMKYAEIVDNTSFIKASIHEVIETFIEAMLLVLFIVFIFLQSWRATLIPMLAIPVSLIGTFGAFVALDFSINTLTLFAMVLAIGLVVDDAIVVVEAVEHAMRYEGLNPKEATIRAMEQVSGPVVAIAFVLASVFIPVAFFGGTIGVLYKQFALTIVVSMALSAVVALSLTPALCVLLLKPHDPNGHKGILARFFERFNEWFDKVTEGYSNTVKRCISYCKLGVVFVVILVGLCLMFNKIVPSAFMPDEDQGYYMVSLNLPNGASLNRTMALGEEVAKMMKEQDGVLDTMNVNGMDLIGGGRKPNAGAVWARLADWEERPDPQQQVDALVQDMMIKGSQIPEGTVMAFNPPALPGFGSTGGFSMVIINRDGTADADKMAEVTGQFLAAANQRPEVAMAYTTYESNTPGFEFEVDREKAKDLGIALGDIFTALQANLGGASVNDFNIFGKTYKVMLQSETEYRSDTNTLNMIYLTNNKGERVPLDTLLKAKAKTGAPVVKRFNNARSVSISGASAPGYSSGQTMQALIETADQVLPDGFEYDWTGMSREEANSSSSTSLIFALAFIFVFLCLAALYESWSVPLVVLLSVPTGILGALGSQYLRGLTNNVYMQIGLIMLIGLAAKNAILIVEYAKVRYDKGMPAGEAALEASKLRLRPIIMTSLAFILGCIPLAVATGAGAGGRVAMGTSVVGGMITATLLGIFLIPVLYVIVMNSSSFISSIFAKIFKKKTPEAEIAVDDQKTDK